MVHTVFAYGTLQFGEIMAAVTGEAFEGVPATLEGYARYCVEAAPYPGITPAPGGRVDGRLYSGIGARALVRIDEFEGDLYHRASVTVRDGSGRRRAAVTYVVRPHSRGRLVDTPWDADAFARRWHDLYVQACRAGEDIA